MMSNPLIKLLLAPFSLLYGVGVGLRNFFYRKGLLKGITFNLPVISVGNLSVGGAGKTPHIEYLIRLQKDYLNLSTLSRGYSRKTRGYIEVDPRMNAEQVGDEPLQFKRKFPDVLVTVSESRTFGIPKIVQDHPDTQVVLLDDAFQHRSVKPGLNILLTEFDRPFTRDYLLPAGRLREWRSAYQRADIIIVSKCPNVLTEADRQQFIAEINPLPHQQVYFSYYDYGDPYYIFDSSITAVLEPDVEVLLICAIARTDYLVDYLNDQVSKVRLLSYEDHHYFSKFDVSNLRGSFERMGDVEKVMVLTTEKDAMRLELHADYLIENEVPIFALPVEVKFHFNEGEIFDQSIKDFLLNFTV